MIINTKYASTNMKKKLYQMDIQIPVKCSFANSSEGTRDANVSGATTRSYSDGLLQYKSDDPGAGKNLAITASTIEMS